MYLDGKVFFCINKFDQNRELLEGLAVSSAAYYETLGLRREIFEEQDYYTRWSLITPLKLEEGERYPVIFWNHGGSNSIECEECITGFPEVAAQQYSFSIILHRFSFHKHAGSQQIISFKNRCHPIHNVLICFFHIVRYHIFKRKHSFYVQISGSGNKIFFICIFSCKLITDQMTAVIQIFSIDKIIFHSMPAGRLYRTNISTLLRRHQILSHARHTDCASSKRI